MAIFTRPFDQVMTKSFAIAIILFGASLAQAGFTPLENPVNGPSIDLSQTTSSTSMVNYKNTGTTKSSLELSASGPGYLITLNRCQSVSPGKNCSVYVSFSAKGRRLDQAEQTFKGSLSSATAPLVEINTLVKSVIVAPVISFSVPSTIEYTFPSNTTKFATVLVPVTNTGNIKSIPTLSFQTNNSRFLVVLDRCVSGIRPGDSCDVVLQGRQLPGDVTSQVVISSNGQQQGLASITLHSGVPAAPTPVPTPLPFNEPQLITGNVQTVNGYVIESAVSESSKKETVNGYEVEYKVNEY